MRTLSDRALNTLGYSVLAAPSGWDALRVAERHRGPIHLVLTDVVISSEALHTRPAGEQGAGGHRCRKNTPRAAKTP